MALSPPSTAVRQLRQLYGSALRTSKSVSQLDDSVGRLEAIGRATLAGSPIDQFVLMSYATREDGLFDGTYDLWRVKRIAKILAMFGLDWFPGKRILELGAGHGDIGAVLADLGAEVTCVEGRTENLNFGRLKYRNQERLAFVQMDLDGDFTSLGRHDLILHLGLLYHIADIDEHLARCFELGDEILLETVVCDSTDPHRMIVLDEDRDMNEDALNGRGARPSPFYVERLADEAGFDVERHFTSDLNSDAYVYDWEHTDSGEPSLYQLRRFWRFCRADTDG